MEMLILEEYFNFSLTYNNYVFIYLFSNKIRGVYMPKRNVFYSFHYDNDVFRVQQIRNMGVIYGNEPVNKNKWEEIKRRGNTSIQQWINNEISKCSCVIVLVGSQTSTRPWVKYEIEESYRQKKGLLGIYIHNLKDLRTGKCCSKGDNPFRQFKLNYNSQTYNLANIINCYDPIISDAYNDIYNNLPSLIEDAIDLRDKIHYNSRF